MSKTKAEKESKDSDKKESSLDPNTHYDPKYTYVVAPGYSLFGRSGQYNAGQKVLPIYFSDTVELFDKWLVQKAIVIEK